MWQLVEPGRAEKMNERKLHETVVAWLKVSLPHDAVFHHSPNEGRRGWHAQRAIKSHGVHKGWPDIEIIYRGQPFFIELKAPGKYPTPAQRETIAALKAAGAECLVARSIEHVNEFLVRFMELKTHL